MYLRCLLVDDSARFLEAAWTLLERQGVTVVGAASTGAEAYPLAARLVPDVILLDIGLLHESGFDVAAQLARTTSAAVILISTHSLEDFEELISESPARGFVPKSALSATAIREVLGAS
ncbi:MULTISPECIES: response regulator transcription factor [unclassified Streptomyces]|uniref:Response regulator transcription factor n=1 Tax=Streptomyces sp. NBC_00060 TaxID=2975636 RepID=A0AAU2GTL0_9ACTN